MGIASLDAPAYAVIDGTGTVPIGIYEPIAKHVVTN